MKHGLTLARLSTAFAIASGITLADGAALDGQIAYQRGQDVAPAYEGWIQHEDGSKSMVFGYMNRNWQEEVDVPVGEDNFFTPIAADQGQPTHFRPRRNRFVFTVPVPADLGDDEEIVWTLTSAGKTQYAYGTMGIDQVIDNIVVASETGALGIGASNAKTRANNVPEITVEGGTEYQVLVGQSLELAVRMMDDGLEEAIENWEARQERAAAALAKTEGPPALSAGQLRPPTRITVQKVVWHHVAWFVYRAEGEATPEFDPPQVKTWEDTRTGSNSPWAPLWTRPAVPEDGVWHTSVIFDMPGTYILRARGDDGALYHDQDITVVVSAVASE